MSIQMSLVFGLLVVEMSILVLLLLPLPHMLRVRLLNVCATLRQNKNFQVGLLFTSILLGLQFLDCVNKLKRYATLENPYFAQFNTQQQMAGGLLYDKLASKFYAQRNLYITGAVLYLGLSINTVVSILRKLVFKETSYRELSKNTKSTEADDEQIRSLREQISKREVDIATMKKQLKGLQSAYDGLSASGEKSKDE